MLTRIDKQEFEGVRKQNLTMMATMMQKARRMSFMTPMSTRAQHITIHLSESDERGEGVDVL